MIRYNKTFIIEPNISGGTVPTCIGEFDEIYPCDINSPYGPMFPSGLEASTIRVDNITGDTIDVSKIILSGTSIDTLFDSKVDVDGSKVLSDENYTTSEKSKLNGIEANAQVNVQSDWDAVSGDAFILNKPTLSGNDNDYVTSGVFSTSTGSITLTRLSGGTINYNIDGRYSLLNHTHTFASLTAKPTTIGGYGITDFNSLGDTRWSQLGHTHVISDITGLQVALNLKADDTDVVKLAGTQTITGSKTFSVVPKSSQDASASTDLVRKSQFDTGLATKENNLGNPGSNGLVLSSTTGGTRSWVTFPTGVTTYATLSDRTTVDLPTMNIPLANALGGKVDVDGSKVLSDNNYTTTEKSKLSGIAIGAEVNVQSDWNAVSGDTFILNKPTLTGNDNDYVSSGVFSTSTGDVTLTRLSGGTVSYNLDGRYSLTSHTHTFASLTAKPTTIGGYGITDFNSLGDARWSLLGHTHVIGDITGLQTVLNNKANQSTTYTKVEVDGFVNGKENSLGNPSSNGLVLTSTTGGTRSWVSFPAGVTTYATLTDRATVDLPTMNIPLANALGLKVDKDGSKVLSDENYTNTEKSKLSGIEANAQVNVQSDWDAVSGDAFILNKPTLSGNDNDYITSGVFSASTGSVTLTRLSGGTVSYNLDGRYSLLNHTHTFASLTAKPNTISGYGITDFNNLGDARWSLLGHTHTFASLTAKPNTISGYGITDFNSLGDVRWADKVHTHVISDITGLQSALNLKSDDTDVVKLTGTQTVDGAKTFSIVPKSSQDASGTTDLIRKSQFDTQLNLKANQSTTYTKLEIDGFVNGKENSLGNPSSNGLVLTSTTGGTRSWVNFPAGVTTYATLTDRVTVDLPTINTPLANALNSKEDGLGNPSVSGRVLASTTTGVRSWVELPVPGGGGVTTYAALSDRGSVDLPTMNIPLANALSGKVDVDGSKVLSDNNYTNTEKSKLSGIEANAQVNVQSDWNAVSGDTFILNKPILSGNDDDYVTSGVFDISDGDVTLTRLSGGTVTYNLDGRYSLLNHTHTFASLTAKPTTIGGYGITDFNSLGDGRWSLLGHTHTFASLTVKPTTISGYGITDFNSLGDGRWSLLGHTHVISDITGLQSVLDTKATDTLVVKLAGTQTITGSKTFSVVPKSSQDASVSTDLVRKSQFDTALNLKANQSTTYTKVEVDGFVGGKENNLGNPGSNGQVLTSTTGGTRSWVSFPTGVTTYAALTDRVTVDLPTMNTPLANALGDKVDKDGSKVLSDNNYTNTEKSKLSGIEANAQVNVQSDWNAVSGDAFILNKPTLSGNDNDYVTSGVFDISDGDVTLTRLSGGTVTYNLDGRYSLLNHTHTFASLTAKPTTIGGYGITDFNSLGDGRWSLLSHGHIIGDITGLQSALDTKATDTLVVKLAGTQTITGSKTFSLVPKSSQDASGNNDLIRKSQFDTTLNLYTGYMNDALDLKENSLGNPGSNGQVLSSTTGGVRSWVSFPAGVTTYATLSDRTTVDLPTMNTPLANALGGKVDVDGSKVLSDNNYTNTEKSKLSGIATGAEVNVQSDWDAVSGDAFILNKPTLTGNDNDYVTSGVFDISDGDLTLTRLSGGTVSYNLDGRYSLLNHTHTFASLTAKPNTISGYGITDFNSLGDARWSQLGHTHVIGDITGLQSVLDSKATDTLVVKLAGTQTISGGKTFSIVPKSSQDASASTDLVRKSQFDTQLNLKVDSSTLEVTVRGFLDKSVKILSGTTYTLLSSDFDKILHFTNISGCLVTVPSSLPLNNRYEGVQMSAGQVSFIGSGGVVIKTNASETNKTDGENSLFALDVLSSDVYILYGRLETTGGGGVTTYAALSDRVTVDLPTMNTPLASALSGKVDVDGSKVLSDNNYTNTEKSKLSGIEANAQVNVQSDWNAVSGDAFILNKPSSFPPSVHTHTFASLTAKPTTIGGYGITDFNSLGDVRWADKVHTHIIDDVTGLQAALNLKANDNIVVKTSGTQTIGGSKTFSSAPKSSVAASADNDLMRKGEVEIALSNFKEENIMGTAVDSYLNGGDTLDLSLVSHYNIAVVANSIVTFSGFPPVGNSFTRTGTIISSTGVETLSFSNATNEFGSYDPTKINFITVMVTNTAVAGVVINIFYAQTTKKIMELSYNATTDLNLVIQTESGDDWEIDWGDGVWERYTSSTSFRSKYLGSPTAGVARVRSATGRELSDLHWVRSNNGTWSFNVADLCATYYANFDGNSMAITGDVGGIKATNTAKFQGNLMTLTGDVGDIKTTNTAYFRGNLMTLTGNVGDIKADYEILFNGGSMTLTGDVGDIKATYYAQFIGDSMTLTGDVGDIKATYLASFRGDSIVLTYTTKTWTHIPTGVLSLDLATGHLTTAEVSQMLIDMDASGITGFTALDLQYNNGAPNAAGITAANNLIAKGYTVLTN